MLLEDGTHHLRGTEAEKHRETEKSWKKLLGLFSNFHESPRVIAPVT